MSGDVSPEELVAALTELTQTMSSLLQYGQDVVKESTEEFVNGKIGKMFGFATAYQKCMKRVGVATKEELEKKVAAYSRHAAVREAGDDLLDCEQDWDTFLAGVDKGLGQGTSKAVQPGETGPINFDVTDARSGQKTSLAQQLTGSDNMVLVLLRHFA